MTFSIVFFYFDSFFAFLIVLKLQDEFLNKFWKNLEILRLNHEQNLILFGVKFMEILDRTYFK